MPDFARAEIATSTEDLTQYRSFLKKLAIGQVVMLPLEEGESSRKVMRALNTAAEESGYRLTRLVGPKGSVRFKVASPEKRKVNISPAALTARVQKARATRAARSQAAKAA